jgi:hypothetical protein
VLKNGKLLEIVDEVRAPRASSREHILVLKEHILHSCGVAAGEAQSCLLTPACAHSITIPELSAVKSVGSCGRVLF